MALTIVQKRHVATAYPECQSEMSRYLATSAHVVIHRQNECGNDTLPFAICVSGGDFWIDCCRTADEAKTRAERLGLVVHRVRQ